MCYGFVVFILNPKSMNQWLKGFHNSIKVVMIIVGIAAQSKVTN